MVQARIVQRIGGLPGIQLNQPRLPVTGRVGLAEKSYHHANRVAAGIDDGRAENRPEADQSGRVDKRKIGAGRLDVFNQHAAIGREERRRQLAERLDLLRGEAGKTGDLQRLAGALRQQEQHGQICLLQRGDGGEHIIQQALQFQVAGKTDAEIVKTLQVAALRFKLVAQAGKVSAERAGNHFRRRPFLSRQTHNQRHRDQQS